MHAWRIVLIPIAAGAIVVGACSSFSSDDDPSTLAPDEGGAPEASGDVVGPATEGGLDGGPLPGCTLSPDAGPLVLGTAKCGDGMTYDLRVSEAHCGACENACAIGHTCSDGVCRGDLVTTSSAFPVMGAVVGGGVFYTHSIAVDGGTTPSLERFDLGGGPVTTSLLPPSIAGVAADGTATYVVDYGNRLTAVGDDGGVRFEYNGSRGGPLAARDGRIAFVSPLFDLRVLAADGGLLTFKGRADGAKAFALDEQAVYWITGADASSQATLSRADLATGALLSTKTPPSEALAVDDVFLYFYVGNAKEVRRIRKDLKSPSELVARWTGSGGESTSVIAVDGQYLYVMLTGLFNTALVRVPKCGGVPRILAPDGSGGTPYGNGQIAVDATYVYFPTNNGEIRRVPK